jgi:hypothetical protein
MSSILNHWIQSWFSNLQLFLWEGFGYFMDYDQQFCIPILLTFLNISSEIIPGSDVQWICAKFLMLFKNFLCLRYWLSSNLIHWLISISSWILHLCPAIHQLLIHVLHRFYFLEVHQHWVLRTNLFVILGQYYHLFHLYHYSVIIHEQI